MSDKAATLKIPRAFDKYTMQARVTPALVVILPLVLAAAVWDPKITDTIHVLSSIFLAMGAVALLSHLARTAGKQAERAFLLQWGGWPSTIMLRYGNDELNPIDKLRYHAALGRLVPGIKMPSPDEESTEPKAADHVYEACCTWLKAQTVDEHKFHRLFAENISYGFRRNLYGLRRFAVTSETIGLLACVARIMADLRTHSALTPISIFCLVSCIGLGLAFKSLLTPAAVRAAGDDYARRLLGAIDELSSDKPKSKNQKTKSSEGTE